MRRYIIAVRLSRNPLQGYGILVSFHPQGRELLLFNVSRVRAFVIKIPA